MVVRNSSTRPHGPASTVVSWPHNCGSRVHALGDETGDTPENAGRRPRLFARMQFENSVTIRRPPSEVFAFVVDPANIPKWNYAIVSARQVGPGPSGVGTRIQHTRSLPRPSTEELVVTEFVPERRMVLQGDLGPPLRHAYPSH